MMYWQKEIETMDRKDQVKLPTGTTETNHRTSGQLPFLP